MSRLGRGLAAIIPVEVMEAGRSPNRSVDRDFLRRIPLDRISHNPAQPRLTFNGPALEQLA